MLLKESVPLGSFVYKNNAKFTEVDLVLYFNSIMLSPSRDLTKAYLGRYIKIMQNRVINKRGIKLPK
jgi:hypothetical protein